MSEHETDAAPPTLSTPQRRPLLGLDRAELEAWCEAESLPKYRAGQILSWIYAKLVTTFDAMTDLPADLRRRLDEAFVIQTAEVARRAESNDGTIKTLLRWSDGATCECVMIPDGDRRTACIGSQVGCPVQCVFCASGLEGLERNLTRGEILEQLLCVARDSRVGGGRLSNVVFMGSGEPLANYDEVMAAVRTLHAPWGVGLGARRITISTVGLPARIRRLSDEKLPVNLALSLHAPNESLRREIIPWAGKIRLDELVAACRFYFERTGREITLEYILLGGVNDGASHADELATLCSQLRCNVNLIRYNPVEPLPFRRPTPQAAARFQESLRRRGVNSHLRRSRGLDIDAACGQLRRKAKLESDAGGAVVQINLPRPDQT